MGARAILDFYYSYSTVDLLQHTLRLHSPAGSWQYVVPALADYVEWCEHTEHAVSPTSYLEYAWTVDGTLPRDVLAPHAIPPSDIDYRYTLRAWTDRNNPVIPEQRILLAVRGRESGQWVEVADAGSPREQHAAAAEALADLHTNTRRVLGQNPDLQPPAVPDLRELERQIARHRDHVRAPGKDRP